MQKGAVARGDTGAVSVPAFLEKEEKFGMVRTGVEALGLPVWS